MIECIVIYDKTSQVSVEILLNLVLLTSMETLYVVNKLIIIIIIVHIVSILAIICTVHSVFNIISLANILSLVYSSYCLCHYPSCQFEDTEISGASFIRVPVLKTIEQIRSEPWENWTVHSFALSGASLILGGLWFPLKCYIGIKYLKLVNSQILNLYHSNSSCSDCGIYLQFIG